MQINLIQLELTVETAKAKAANSPSWLRAIERAAQVLRENPYVEVLENGDVLLLSATSNTLYQINGRCTAENGQPCKGYTYNNGVCYHRCLKRLVDLYNGAVEDKAQERRERENSVMVKPERNGAQIDGWWV